MKPALGRLLAKAAPLVLLALAATIAWGQAPPASAKRVEPVTATPAAPRRPPKAAPLILEGVLKGPDGKPVEGARVTFRSADGSSDSLPKALTTDATGRFRSDLRRSSRLDLRVEAKGFAARTLEGVRPGTPLTITLDRGRALQGTVRDPAGQPVPGARVEARAATGFFLAWDAEAGVASATTDARGRFRIEGLEAALLTVRASAPGGGSASRNHVRAGGRADLVLGPGSGLAGTVIDSQGAPVKGALVRAEGIPWGGGDTVTTDAQGRYQVASLAPGTYTLIVRHGDFAPAVVSDVVIGADGEHEESVSLEPGVEVTGRLVADEERPVPGTVRLSQWGENHAPASLLEVLRADAGADGRFRLPRLAGGRYAFDARSPGVGRRRFDVSPSAGEKTLDLGDLLIEPGLAIRGHVRTKAGAAVPEAVVTASRKQQFFGGTADEEARSQGDGSFLLGGLAAGSYNLRATAPGHTAASAEAVAGAAAVDLRVGAAGSLTGVVVEEGDRPVEGYHVQVQPLGSDERGRYEGARKSVGASDGRFLLEDLGVASYVVRVIVPDRAPATVSGVKVAEGQTTDVGVIRVPRGGVVRGLVSDAAGGPVTGARVTVSTGEMDILTWYGLLSDQSDAQGAFEIRGVPAGPARVKATHPSYATGLATVEVEPAKEPADARLLLRQGGRIEGSAHRRDGQPLAGQTIMLAFSEGGGGMDAAPPTTGADGSFVVDHVPPGQVTLVLMATVGPGRFVNTISRQVDVLDGQTVTVELVSRDVLVTGRVTRNRSPAAGVDLAFQNTSGFMMGMAGSASSSSATSKGPRRNEATTREDGAFELIVSEPARYSVSAFSAAPSVGFPGRMVDIPDVEAFSLDLDFSGATVSGVVVAEDTQEPVPWASVNVSPQESRNGEGTVGASTGPDGRFELVAAAGEYRLNAQAQAYAATDQSLRLGESGATDLRIELERGLEITGRVVNAAGQGVPGMHVIAHGPGVDQNRPRGFAQTRGDGSFDMGGLRDAAYNLCAGSELAGYAIRAGVKPGPRDLILTLRPGGRVRLRVTGPDGAPFNGAFPTVRSVNGVECDVPVSGGTDVAGQTEVTVPTGSLELRAWNEKGSGRTTVDVEVGQTVDAEIRLTDPPDRP